MRALLRSWLGLNMLQQLAIAVVAGAIIGYLFPGFGTAIKPLGDIVLRLIKMIIVPLIFASIAMSVLELKEVGKAARVGGLAFGLYLMTTLAATVLAVTIAGLAFQWIDIPAADQLARGDMSSIAKGADNYAGFWGTIFTIVPDNLLKAFVEGNTLATIVFAVAVGMLILVMKSDQDSEHGNQLERMLSAVTRLIYRFIDYVIKMMPFAVFAFIAWMVATQDYQVFAALAQMLAVGFTILILHVLLTYGTLLRVVGRVSVPTFLRKIAPVQLFAFSSASSAATIPLNERVLQNKIGVSRETSSFTVPFGATVNMDGTAIAQCTYAIFIAHMYGMDLSLMQYVTLAVMSAVVSVGVAAVPSASLVTLSVVLGVVGIPVEGIAFILATDRLFDMARTAVNVTGDASVSVAVDRLEGRFNDDIFARPADQQDLEASVGSV
jgi:Na+/H+-dicarboxylate symporter